MSEDKSPYIQVVKWNEWNGIIRYRAAEFVWNEKHGWELYDWINNNSSINIVLEDLIAKRIATERNIRYVDPDKKQLTKWCNKNLFDKLDHKKMLAYLIYAAGKSEDYNFKVAMDLVQEKGLA